MRVELAPSSIGHLPPQSIPALVRVSIRSGAENLKPGDAVSLRAVLMPPPAPAAPDDYDFGRAAYYLRIGAVGYAFGKPTMIAPHNASGWGARLSAAIESLRWRMTQHIQAELPGSTGGIAAALITGDRGSIDADDEQSLRDAGLAHVLAIAGLHMALVGLGLFWVVRALLALIPPTALRYPIKKWAAVAALFWCHVLFDYQRCGGARDACLRHAGDDAGRDPVRPAGAVDALRCAGGCHHSLPEAGKPDRTGFSDVVRCCGEPCRRRRMGTESAVHGGELLAVAGCSPLYARHRHDEFRGQRGDGAVRGVSFRTRDALCRNRQSWRDADHGVRDHAGGCYFRSPHAVGPRPRSATRYGVGNRCDAGGRSLGLGPAGRRLDRGSLAHRRNRFSFAGWFVDGAMAAALALVRCAACAFRSCVDLHSAAAGFAYCARRRNRCGTRARWSASIIAKTI